MIRWVAYWLIVVSLAAAVLLSGGAHPQQWQWSALGLSMGATLALLGSGERDRSSQKDWGVVFLGLLAAWMVIQWLPLPGWALQRLSPDHWSAVVAARAATGLNLGRWATLSLAPGATLERLLNVIPALAAFLTARQMAWWWRDRMWILVAPVVAIAWPESVLGMAQFYFTRIAHGQSDPATGTYVYHNHFAGLLEMAFPLAVLWAVWTFKQGATPHKPEKLGPALKAAALLGIAACMLGGIVTSLSRMGFVSLIAATVLTGVAVIVAQSYRRHERQRQQRQRWVLATAVALPLLILLLVLPPNELIARFGQITTDPEMTIQARADIWGNTMREVAASPWTGVGLGAYEHGLYQFKTIAPTSTVDFAHNDYLQILAELGIPGAVLAGAVAAWILLRCSSVVLLMARSANWEFAVGLFAGLVILGLHSLADFNLYSPANALVLAWLGGVAVSPGLREC